MRFLNTFFMYLKCNLSIMFNYCLNYRNKLVKVGNQCILQKKKVFQNIVLTLAIHLLVHWSMYARLSLPKL